MYDRISSDIVIEELKEILSDENIEEKYIRDFLNCSIIDKGSYIDIDKIMFIYKYGSEKAKRIAVDEKLKIV